MQGLMQDWPLTVDRIITHAERIHGTREVITRRIDGTLHRTTLENHALAHPAIAHAGAIGVPHPKWDERPLLAIELKPGETLSEADLRAFLAARIAKWWMPDTFVFLDPIPLGATGKVNKQALRQLLADAQHGTPPE